MQTCSVDFTKRMINVRSTPESNKAVWCQSAVCLLVWKANLWNKMSREIQFEQRQAHDDQTGDT